MRAVLLPLGGLAAQDDSVVQLRDKTGSLFTVYRVPPESEWEFRSEPLCAAAGVKIPDLATATGLALECRSEVQFSALVTEIAGTSGVDMWVIDGNGVVWSARDVDARLVRL